MYNTSTFPTVEHVLRWLSTTVASHGESHRAGHSVSHPVASVPQIVVLVHKYSKHSGSSETAGYLQAV